MMIMCDPRPLSPREINLEWLLRPLNFSVAMGRQSRIQCAMGRMEQVTGAYAFLTEAEQARADEWRVMADEVMRQLRGVP